MKILHYSPKENGIRFFRSARKYLELKFRDYRSITDEENLYKSHRTIKTFKNDLAQRSNYPDVVIIMAHGSEDSILKHGDEKKYIRIMTKDETNLFNNDFVFALSCYTCKEFGKSAIENNALVYIGFDDSIENVFKINNIEYRSLSKKLEIVIKKIYMSCFVNEFEKFIKNCFTAEEFTQRLSLRINIEITKLIKMKIDDINKMFNIKIHNNQIDKMSEIIRLELINKFDYINKKMILLGEKNYIPWYFIKSQTKESLDKIMQKLDKIHNENYKYSIEAYINETLNNKKEALEYMKKGMELAEKKGEDFIYNKIFA